MIIKKDTYDFEMHSWLKEPGRNMATLIARPIHGKGTPFDIFCNGTSIGHAYLFHTGERYHNTKTFLWRSSNI